MGIMNAFGKCNVRKPQMMHLLGSYLDNRVHQLSSQNVSNITNAFARLECYSHDLFFALQSRVMEEDLSDYKLYELAIMTHSLAKLRCGGPSIYKVLFDEFVRRDPTDSASSGASASSIG